MTWTSFPDGATDPWPTPVTLRGTQMGGRFQLGLLFAVPHGDALTERGNVAADEFIEPVRRKLNESEPVRAYRHMEEEILVAEAEIRKTDARARELKAERLRLLSNPDRPDDWAARVRMTEAQLGDATSQAETYRERLEILRRAIGEAKAKARQAAEESGLDAYRRATVIRQQKRHDLLNRLAALPGAAELLGEVVLNEIFGNRLGLGTTHAPTVALLLAGSLRQK